MSPRKQLAILTSDDAHHEYLIHCLTREFEVRLVVVEPAVFQRRRLLRRHKLRDYFWAQYHASRRRVAGLNRYRRNYFALPPPSNASPAERVVVNDINEPRVIELLDKVRPDLTVIICTSILRMEVIQAGRQVVNVHGGLLPYDRGNHCFFWAMYDAAPDRVGSTLHFVDVGIDTGDIIERVVPSLLEHDTPERLYCRAELMAIHRLVELLHAWESGQPLPRSPQPFRGRLHLTRDRRLRHEVAFWLWRRRLWAQAVAHQHADVPRVAPPFAGVKYKTATGHRYHLQRGKNPRVES